MRIEIDDFLFEIFSTKVRFSILIFIEKVKLFFLEKNVVSFWREPKFSIFWALFSQFRFWRSAKKERFGTNLRHELEVFDWELDGNIWACSYEEKTVWRLGFYNVNSMFWRNRKIRIANDRLNYMIVPYSLSAKV